MGTLVEVDFRRHGLCEGLNENKRDEHVEENIRE
jgi:hypothetical protein